jgi:O-antigen/teichoic acid export membrane protein
MWSIPFDRNLVQTLLRPRMLKNLLIVGFSSGFAYASTFARGIVLARILGPHEFGLAVIILSITGALDIFADAGIDRFVVQSRFGHRSDMMRTSHAFRVGGSTLIGLVIVALSYPLSRIFHAPQLWLPIALTGGVVTIRGLVNLSFKLQQRDHRFERETYIDIARSAADLTVTTTVALLTHSFWAVLAGSYTSALVQLVMSHFLADRSYSFWPRRQLVALVGRFSVPIYINAAFLFAAMQGDRMVVAAMFSKRELGLYAAACAIGQGITGLTGHVTMNTFLPIMARSGQDFEARRRQTNGLGVLFIGGSVVFLAGMSLLGPIVVPLLYGPAYSHLAALIFAASITQMIQLEQGWLTTLLMANGLTARFPMITIMRAAAFPAAILFVSMGFSILAIPLAFAMGAAVSLASSYHAARSLKLIDRRLIIASFTRICLATGAVILLAKM